VSVEATNVSYKLGLVSAPAGKVTFVVHNAGTTTHDLVVLYTSVPQDKIPTDPSQPAKMLEPGLVGQILSLAPGATGTLTLNLAAGPYVLMCNQPAHYLIGMHVAFTVTAP
jgi:uncharacterized cupredoxin-like copper-binding protein